jgi:SAM-dependent methyltransferase
MAEGAKTFRTSAALYDRFVGRYSTALSHALVEEAGIEPGMRVLDVGCGPGGLTAVLAGLVGADRVAAVDPSEPFVDACRERVPGADVRHGAAEHLPFVDGEFDAALSQLVVNFMTDAPAGVAELRRVTRPGGIVASCVWDYAGEMWLLRHFWDAAAAVDPDRAASLDEGVAMRWCSEAELRSLWEGADLEAVETGALVVSAAYEGLDGLWAPLEGGVGPAGAYCASLDQPTRAALRAELDRRLGSPDGPFELTARAWFVRGRR